MTLSPGRSVVDEIPAIYYCFVGRRLHWFLTMSLLDVGVSWLLVLLGAAGVWKCWLCNDADRLMSTREYNLRAAGT